MAHAAKSSDSFPLRALIGPFVITLLTGILWFAQSGGQVVPNLALLYLIVLVAVCLTSSVIGAVVNMVLAIVAILLLYHEVGRLGSSGEPLVRLLMPITAFIVGPAIVVAMRWRLATALAAPVVAERMLFEAIMSSMHDAIVETDWQGIRNVNASFCKMTGFSREELIGSKAPFPFWPIEQYASIAAALENSMRGAAADFELVLNRKNGERFPVLLSVSRILDAAGTSNRVLYSFREITDLKRTQQQLQERERTLQQAIDAARMGTWDWDIKTGKVKWAGHHEALWGMKPGEFDNTIEMAASRMEPRDREAGRLAAEAIRANRGTLRFEHRVIWPDGSIHWMQVTGAYTYDDKGEPVRMSGVVQEITEKREAEMLLAAEGEILGKIARGTDIGETLTALVTMIENILDGALCSILTLVDGKRFHVAAAPNIPTGYLAYVEGFEIGPANCSCGTAAYSGKRTVASDIQTDPRWAPWKHIPAQFNLRSCTSEPIRAHDGKVLGTFAVYFHDIRELAPHQLHVLEMAAQLAAIALERDHEEKELRDAKEAAEIANRTKDRFLNLLSHELRSPLTPILTLASVLENDLRLPEEIRADMGMIRRNAEVEAALVDELLELVRTAQGPLSPDIESNVRDVRENARAEQRSEPGDIPRVVAPAARPLRILLVEDHSDTAKILARMLTKRGHTVTIATTVAEGVDKGLTGTFDLLLSDVGLPDGSGHELLTKLRAVRPIPAIALSGFGSKDDIQRSVAAGFALHLVKPVNFHSLHDAIEQLTSS